MTILSAFLGALRWFIWAVFKGGIAVLPAFIGALKWLFWALGAVFAILFRLVAR